MIKIFKINPFLILFALFSSSAIYAAEPIGVPDRSKIEYEDEEPTELEIQLGKTLFFDTRLSVNDKFSCATCHNPDLGFSDGMKSSNGTMGNKLHRKTPHVHNLAWSNVFFWDGRSSTLEEQALGPIEAPGEMNMPLGQLLPKLKAVPWYVDTFKAVYGDSGITKENVGKAIANYERSLIVDDTAFDRYVKGDLAAMAPSQIRGMKLFNTKARCALCHNGPNFSDDSFHNIGVSGPADPGRYKVVKDKTLMGAFKTPGLRNVALRAPYMHNVLNLLLKLLFASTIKVEK